MDKGTTPDQEAQSHTEEQRIEEQERFWGARDSLRKNARRSMASITKKNIMTSEETPLLGNGSTSSTSGSGDDNGRNGHGSGDSSDATLWEGHADYNGITWWRKPSIYWLVPAFFMFALAIGGIVVPKLNLILSLVCREYLAERSSLDPSLSYQEPSLLDSDNPQCRIPEVQSLVTKFALYMSLLTGILSSIMSPRMGALSDRYGRVKFLVITSLGGLMMEVITILAGRYPDTVHYRWILAGSIVDGLCGSFTAGMALTHAYAADCTAPPKRAVAFGYFHACLFSGIAIGPLFAAYILRMTGSLVSVFFVALGIHATFILFMLFAVPESLTEKRRSMARERHLAKEIVFPPNLDMMSASQNVLASTGLFIRSINPFSPLKILWPTGPRTSNHLRANLVVLASVDTIVFGVAMGSMAVLVYYTGFQFGWGSADTSIFVSIVNSSRVFALVAILPLFNYLVRTRRRNKARRESGFDIPERNSGSDSIDLFIIRISIVFEIVGYAIYATARTGPLFILGGVLASLGGIGSPTLGAALTKHVPHERVGQLLGATGLLHAQARIVGPAVFNFIYAETVGSFPQAVFVCLTACFGVAFLVSWFIRPNVYLEEQTESPTHTTQTNYDPDVLVDEEIAGL